MVPKVPKTINIDGDTSVSLSMIVLNKLILLAIIINDDSSSSSNAVTFYYGSITSISIIGIIIIDEVEVLSKNFFFHQ
jgi:hypothetical protein